MMQDTFRQMEIDRLRRARIEQVERSNRTARFESEQHNGAQAALLGAFMIGIVLTAVLLPLAVALFALDWIRHGGVVKKALGLVLAPAGLFGTVYMAVLVHAWMNADPAVHSARLPEIALQRTVSGLSAMQHAAREAAASAGSRLSAAWTAATASQAEPAANLGARAHVVRTTQQGRPAQAVAAPSFDCQLARGHAEKLICANQHLAALDRRMASAYRTALQSGDSRAHRRAQRRWLAEERDLCRDADCLYRTMQARLGQLEIQDRHSGTRAALDR